MTSSVGSRRHGRPGRPASTWDRSAPGWRDPCPVPSRRTCSSVRRQRPGRRSCPSPHLHEIASLCHPHDQPRQDSQGAPANSQPDTDTVRPIIEPCSTRSACTGPPRGATPCVGACSRRSRRSGPRIVVAEVHRLHDGPVQPGTAEYILLDPVSAICGPISSANTSRSVTPSRSASLADAVGGLRRRCGGCRPALRPPRPPPSHANARRRWCPWRRAGARATRAPRCRA